MKQALGLVEISGLSTAVVVADTMVKAANIRILEVENTKGLGYMTIKAEGDVGAVKAAVDAGCQIGRMYGKLVSWKVLPRPSDSVENTFCKKEAVKPPVPPQPPEPESSTEEPVELAEPEVPETVEAPETSETPETAEAPEIPEVQEMAESAEISEPEVKKTTRRANNEKRKK